MQAQFGSDRRDHWNFWYWRDGGAIQRDRARELRLVQLQQRAQHQHRARDWCYCFYSSQIHVKNVQNRLQLFPNFRSQSTTSLLNDDDRNESVIAANAALEESEKLKAGGEEQLQNSNDEFEMLRNGITQLSKQLSLEVSIEHNNDLMDSLGAIEDRINELIGKLSLFMTVLGNLFTKNRLRNRFSSSISGQVTGQGFVRKEFKKAE